MGTLEGFLYGLEIAVSPELLLAAFVGALAGTLIGILPGLGPVAGAALLLPLTFAYEPAIGMIMIAGIYIGSQFAGSMTAVLLNIPGDAQSIVSTFDGYPMMKNGRGGAALTIMTIGSFISGLIGLGVLLAVMPLVTGVALRFGPAEFFALTAGGLIVLARMTGGSLGSGLLPMIIGVALATVGLDGNSSSNRFTFGHLDLSLGVALASVAVGLYGISELMFMLTKDLNRKKPKKMRWRELVPTKSEFRRSVFPWGRGSLIGFGFGVLPGPSAALATFGSYKVEQTVSKNRKLLGTGAVEGIAAPESANSSATIGSIIPVLVLGIPFSATLALMISAMTVQGIQPGPLLASQRPDLFWSVIASILVANVMLLFLNLPLIGVWIKLIMTPVRYMVPFIVIIAAIGAYSINNNFVDLHIVLFAGILGYFIRLLDFSPASLLVGLVLGPMIERYFIQGSVTYGGDLATLMTASGISITIWTIVIVSLLAGLLKPVWTRTRRSIADRAKMKKINAPIQ